MPQQSDLNNDSVHFASLTSSFMGVVDQEQIEQALSEKLLENAKEIESKKIEKLSEKKSKLHEKLSEISEKLNSDELTNLQRAALESKKISLSKKYADVEKEKDALINLPESLVAIDEESSTYENNIFGGLPKGHQEILRVHSSATSGETRLNKENKNENPRDSLEISGKDSSLSLIKDGTGLNNLAGSDDSEKKKVDKSEREPEGVDACKNYTSELDDNQNEAEALETDTEEEEEKSDGAKNNYGEDHMLLSLKHQTNKEYAITLDDGDEDSYQARLKSWAEKNYEARTGSSVPSSEEWNMLEEIYLPGNLPDEPIKNGFVVPGAIYADLFKYQRTCVMWLYELRLQKVGGIIGDEMGLGKTIQTIALLASLKRSRMLTRPVLVVCPATLMSQWVREIHDWFPPFRCIMLHTSGTGFSKHVRKKRKFRTISEMNSYRTQKLIQKVVDEGHILVTTYSGLQKNSKWLLPVKWGYVILDEGHKLKNPNAGITMTCKRLRTPHRIILTGTPIQNNLTELWSLFDFIYPGRLGTLPVFEAEFSVPINLGGYANASALEITCAYKSARALRSIIQPYMLRRMKAEVAQDLPKKSEQVLFCKITSVQRELYESFLKSKEVNSIIEGSLHPLFGIDVLRKICNHPCLYSFTSSKAFECSGKMIVLKEILKFWKSGNHKVLLFSQKRKVLNLLEELVKDMGYSYKRMDGMTPVKQRGQLVDKFNQNKDVFIFLLTTKVGGLGINLTGADRVVIFDPDWNPSTDMQARERAWRLGQLRPVIIYRLIVSGTIEEKIYQRQIFKTFLSNKVLKDPKQRRFFRLNDLKDLFSIGKESEKESRPETQGLFEEMRPKVDDDSLISELEGVKKLEPMEQTAPTPQNEGPEANMLDRLINKGMHSSLQHEDIIKNTNPEFVIMEQYAEKMLKSSLAALDASRSKLQSYSISAPTWTGHLGLAGKHSTTPSSSILLEKFKHPEGDEGSTRKTLGVEIRDFLDENQGKVKSSDLVRHFKSNLTKGYSTVFKKLLLEVADFQKEEDVGWWVLKNKYRR